MNLDDLAPKIVPAEVVEAAWLEIAALPEDQAWLHMQRLSRRQPGLLPFELVLQRLRILADCRTWMDRLRRSAVHRIIRPIERK